MPKISQHAGPTNADAGPDEVGHIPALHADDAQRDEHDPVPVVDVLVGEHGPELDVPPAAGAVVDGPTPSPAPRSRRGRNS